MGQGITGVDNTNAGQVNAIIEEKVCALAFVNGICGAPGGLPADFTTGGNTSNSATFAAQSTIYILKDIQ